MSAVSNKGVGVLDSATQLQVEKGRMHSKRTDGQTENREEVGVPAVSCAAQSVNITTEYNEALKIAVERACEISAT
jgi:hypothetical protein